MIRQERDYYRWRRLFAWHPKKIDTHWIWLEWYAWRPLKTAEVFPLLKELYAIGPLRPSFWTEISIKKTGFVAWRETHMPLALCPPIHIWHRPKPKLSLVG